MHTEFTHNADNDRTWVFNVAMTEGFAGANRTSRDAVECLLAAYPTLEELHKFRAQLIERRTHEPLLPEDTTESTREWYRQGKDDDTIRALERITVVERVIEILEETQHLRDMI